MPSRCVDSAVIRKRGTRYCVPDPDSCRRRCPHRSFGRGDERFRVPTVECTTLLPERELSILLLGANPREISLLDRNMERVPSRPSLGQGPSRVPQTPRKAATRTGKRPERTGPWPLRYGDAPHNSNPPYHPPQSIAALFLSCRVRSAVDNVYADRGTCADGECVSLRVT